ncbi:MAG: hypothetical protein ACYC0F_05065 [Rhodanobacter sp.]
MIITLEHLGGVPGFSTQPGFCRRGARAWAKRHDIDWARFRYRGIDEAELLAIGDAFAQALVRHAHDWEARRGQQ